MGGYGVDPIYARYGTPFIVNNPIRPGYTFTGWTLTKVDINGDGAWDDSIPGDIPTTLVDTIPSYSCYYKANWVANTNVEATVVYWLQNSEPNANGDYEYSYWQTEKISGLTAGQTVHASSYQDILSTSFYNQKLCQYYEYNDEKTLEEPNVIVDGDGSTVLNVYYDRKEYTLRFIFARDNGTVYQNPKMTNSDNYADVGWDDRTRNENNWNMVTTSQNPKCDSFEEGVWTYYYFSITDKYEARIDDEWAAINNLLANNPIVSDHEFVSWRMNSNSGYGLSNPDNKNLKGAYPYMDDTVLIIGTDGLVDTNIHTLTPYSNTGLSYYQYEIYFKDPNGNYVLENKFSVNPTANYNQQTSFQFVGMELVDTKYYDRDSSREIYEITNTNRKPGSYCDDKYPAIIRFYYDAKDYDLKFYNFNGFIDTMTTKIDFNTALSGYQPIDTPSYPTTLEENAYQFIGWFTTPECITGTEVVWDSATMPASELVLYAKWEPVEHTVRFFMDYDQLVEYQNDNSSVTPLQTVTNITHGDVLGVSVDTPVNEDSTSEMPLIFAGWFYMDNGTKKAYTPLDMPVNSDLLVFADWSSHSPQPYKIDYVLESDNSVSVADSVQGFAYGGTTRTFTAKAGNPYNQLYDAYNSGYFPTLSSHSIVMDVDNPTNPTVNVFKFEYVEATNITYVVNYINKETNVVMDSEVKTTSNSVVTERFIAYPDMVPDAFYKTLVLAVEKDENGDWVSSSKNIINFYYSPNTTTAYYAVHYLLEKTNDDKPAGYEGFSFEEKFAIDGSGCYEETTSHLEGVGDIDNTIEITPITFSGFELVTSANDDGVSKNVATVKTIIKNVDDDAIDKLEYISLNSNGAYDITITENGTELYIFYNRKEYSYNVHYYLYNTTDSLAESKSLITYYGDIVTEDALTISGYTCVSAITQSKTIRDNTETESATINDIIFYYSPMQFTVEYIPVSSEGGTLSRTIEVVMGEDEIIGSIPSVNQYFEFVGWYMDPDCLVPVTSDIATIDTETNLITPFKEKLSDTTRNIFYAKFNRVAGNMIISRSGDIEDINQVFVYNIVNDNGETITVTLNGGSSVIVNGLPLGNYTIVQDNDWSWRYNDTEKIVTHDKAATYLEFNESYTDQWLNGNSDKISNVRGDY